MLILSLLILLMLIMLLTIPWSQQLLEILLTIVSAKEEITMKAMLSTFSYLKYSTTILVALTMLSTTCLLWPSI